MRSCVLSLVANSSKTRMKPPPMIFRFFSGSSTPWAPTWSCVFDQPCERVDSSANATLGAHAGDLIRHTATHAWIHRDGVIASGIYTGAGSSSVLQPRFGTQTLTRRVTCSSDSMRWESSIMVTGRCRCSLNVAMTRSPSWMHIIDRYQHALYSQALCTSLLRTWHH